MRFIFILLLAVEAAASVYQYKREAFKLSTTDNQLGFTVVRSLSYCHGGKCQKNVFASAEKVEMSSTLLKSKLDNENSTNGENNTNNGNSKIKTSGMNAVITISMEEGDFGPYIKYTRSHYDQSRIFLVRDGEVLIQSKLTSTNGQMIISSGDRLLVISSGLCLSDENLIPEGKLVKQFLSSLVDQLPSNTELMAVLIEVSDANPRYKRLSYEQLFKHKRETSGLALAVPFLSYPSMLDQIAKKEHKIVRGRYFTAQRTLFSMSYTSIGNLRSEDSSLSISLSGNYVTLKQSGPTPFIAYLLSSNIKGDERAVCQGVTASFVERVQDGDLLVISRHMLLNPNAFRLEKPSEAGWLNQAEELDAKIDKGETLVFEIIQGRMLNFAKSLLPKGFAQIAKKKHVMTNLDGKNQTPSPSGSLSMISKKMAQLNVED